MAIKIRDNIVGVTRRGFLSRTAGAIAASRAAILPLGEVQVIMPELEQMAQALHDAVGQNSDEGGHVQVCADGRFLNLEVDNLQPCSVHEIQDLLMPLYQGGAS